MVITTSEGVSQRALYRGRKRLWPQSDVLFTFLALFFLSLAPLLGSLAALLFLICVVGLLVFNIRRAAGIGASSLVLLILPLLALLSSLWSVDPANTIRASLQYLATFVFGVVAVRLVGARVVVNSLFFANLLAVLICLVDLPAAITTGQALKGFFGSKNQLAFSAVVLTLTSLEIFFRKRSGWKLRLAAIVGVLMGAVAVSFAQSAGAITSLGLALLVFVGGYVITSLPAAGRLIVAGLLLITVPVAVYQRPAIEAGAASFREGVLKKDATLTGRTYLWYRADMIAAERPWLGHGYQAFWRQGNTDAEGLWQFGQIKNRAGFNFHSEFRELRVDLGWIGLIAFCSLITLSGFGLFSQLLTGVPWAPIVGALFVFLIARVNLETSLNYPFNLYTAIFAMTCSVAISFPRAVRRPGDSRRSHGPVRSASQPSRLAS